MASQVNPLPFPSSDPIIVLRDKVRHPNPKEKDPREGFASQKFQEYMDRQASTLTQATTVVNETSALDQNASIAATDMSGSALAPGTYQFDWFASVRTAAGVTSSLIVTVDFVYRTATKTQSYAAMTGNTTGTFSHGGGIIVIDNASPVRYSTTYASNAAGAMHYDLILVLRRVDA